MKILRYIGKLILNAFFPIFATYSNYYESYYDFVFSHFYPDCFNSYLAPCAIYSSRIY